MEERKDVNSDVKDPSKLGAQGLGRSCITSEIKVLIIL